MALLDWRKDLRAVLADGADEVRRQRVAFQHIAANPADEALLFLRFRRGFRFGRFRCCRRLLRFFHRGGLLLRRFLRLCALLRIEGNEHLCAVLADGADEVRRQHFAFVDIAADRAEPALLLLRTRAGLGLDVLTVIFVGHGRFA
ncbi:hypothetical protein SDC9_154836 [bioreactor metagenome]|uniref:Uncharacterized protein n=1 Tax=bioreactor metagenome TaxID=1076179 RepID=A0A645EZT3_9ZZZZ